MLIYLDSLEGAEAYVSKELCRSRACKEDECFVGFGILLSRQIRVVPIKENFSSLEVCDDFFGEGQQLQTEEVDRRRRSQNVDF